MAPFEPQNPAKTMEGMLKSLCPVFDLGAFFRVIFVQNDPIWGAKMAKKSMKSDKGLPKAPRGGPKGSKRPSSSKHGVQHGHTWTPRVGGGPPQGEFKGLNYYQDSGIHGDSPGLMDQKNTKKL